MIPLIAISSLFKIKKSMTTLLANCDVFLMGFTLGAMREEIQKAGCGMDDKVPSME